MARKKAAFAIVFDGGMMYATVDGRWVAKRPPHEGWVSLEPGWTVRGAEPGNNGGDIANSRHTINAST